MFLQPDSLRAPDRLAALELSGLLELSMPEETFDRLTRLAARLLGTRMVLLSMVSAEAQHLTSAEGLPSEYASQRVVPLSNSLCRHVVRSGAALVLGDARDHPNLCEHPAALHPDVRAYAGVPITLTDGRTLGSFCAVDHVPRTWTERDLTSLRDLAAIAAAEIELRVKAGEAATARQAAVLAEQQFRATFEQAAVGIAHIGLDGRWVQVNQRVCDALGYTRDELCARTVAELIDPRHESNSAALVRRLIAGEILWYQHEQCYRHRDGHRVWGMLTVSLAPSPDPQHAYFIVVIEDITDRKRTSAALATSEAGLRASQTEVLARLAQAAEVRDDDTGLHTRRVGELSARIAEQLELSAEQVALIREAAPLHDVGKIGVRDAILLKRGPLTVEERAQMQRHAALGARLLGGGDAPLIRMAEQIAHAHHERWDGRGYPRGLAGLQIPVEARIVAVADVFDALTSDRPYRDAWSKERAVQLLREGAGTHFDAVVVAAFLRVIEDGTATTEEATGARVMTPVRCEPRRANVSVATAAPDPEGLRRAMATW